MAETLAVSLPTVLDASLGRMTVQKADERLARWSRRLLEQARVQLTVSGREHIEPGRPYLLMSNHVSHYDIPVLFQAFGGSLRMVAKKELFKIPIFAGAMRAAGFIEIDRSNRQRAIESLRSAKNLFAQGISIWMAPEGTRSRSGALLPFKKGGFMLALETHLPILPVAIVGSREILPAEGKAVRPGVRVHVSFQPPIEVQTDRMDTATRDALMHEVRAAIERGLAEGRSVLAQNAIAR